MLRRLEERDVKGMMEWMTNPDVVNIFSFDFLSMTEEKALNFIRNSYSERTQHFAFTDEKDEYMGTISLKNISYTNKNAEYAIASRIQAQGTGMAYQATIEILKYAFIELKLDKVYLYVLEENTKANKFYQKCGFALEGRSREYVNIRGQNKDIIWYGITKKEFMERYGEV